MEPWHLVLLFKPIGLLIAVALLYYCVRRPLQKHMKDGKLKRLLLYRLND